MVTTEIQQLQVLGQRIRTAREGRSQEYVAIRLERTKSWVSKVENGQLRIQPNELRKFAQLVRWSEPQVQEAFTLLGEGSSVPAERRELLVTVEQNLRELGELTDSPEMAPLLITTLWQMDPFPTPPFLQFMVDFTTQALLRAQKSG